MAKIDDIRNGRWHGKQCGKCIDYEYCKKEKNVDYDTEYCQWVLRKWREDEVDKLQDG